MKSALLVAIGIVIGAVVAYVLATRQPSGTGPVDETVVRNESGALTPPAGPKP